MIAVITINAAISVAKVIAGLAADSQALIADALDSSGDTITHSFTVTGMPLAARAKAALF